MKCKLQPGEGHDSRGVPIYPGDLVRSLHFLGRRRQRHYLYHVAVWSERHQCVEMVPTSHLEPTMRGQGGQCFLGVYLEHAADAEVIAGHGPGGCLDYQDRPKRKEVTA